MDFSLTEEQKSIRKTMRDFTETEIVPVARELDEKEEFPLEILKKLYDMGIANLAVPEKYGGSGVDSLTYVIILEELARGCAGVATSATANSNSLALYPLILGGSEELKEKYLIPTCENWKVAAFCLTEPNAGSDIGAIGATAKRDGDSYLINGNKCFITNASYADYLTVFANVVDKEGNKKLSVFMVEADMHGVVKGKKEKKMGLRCSNTAELFFDNVKIPAENLIGEEGDGLKLAKLTLELSRPNVGAISLGIAQAALDAAVAYAKERVQFGKAIASKQGIQFMLADMSAQIDAARLLVYRASYLKDEALKTGNYSFTRESAIAKLYASDAAMQVTTDAVQIFGGYGYSREYMVEKYMRDAKITQIYEGTNQIQRMIIASELLK